MNKTLSGYPFGLGLIDLKSCRCGQRAVILSAGFILVHADVVRSRAGHPRAAILPTTIGDKFLPAILKTCSTLLLVFAALGCDQGARTGQAPPGNPLLRAAV